MKHENPPLPADTFRTYPRQFTKINPSTRGLYMNIGKLIRLNRLFAHPSGRLCSIAVDHFIGYGDGLPPSLAAMKPTLAAIVAADPDAVTMHKGIAASLWQPYAGKLPLIIQSSLAKVDGTAFEQVATAEDALRLGADAIAVGDLHPRQHGSGVAADGGRCRAGRRALRAAGDLPRLSAAVRGRPSRLLHPGGHRLGGALRDGGGRGCGEGARTAGMWLRTPRSWRIAQRPSSPRAARRPTPWPRR